MSASMLLNPTSTFITKREHNCKSQWRGNERDGTKRANGKSIRYLRVKV